MEFYVINLMQLRENKPRLRNNSLLYKQNKVQYMLPLQLLIHQSPFYWQFTGFLSSVSATLVLIGIDAQVTSLWQALHLQTLSSPASGFDFTNRHKSKLQPAETKCFRSVVSKAEERVTAQGGERISGDQWLNISKWWKIVDSAEYNWNLKPRGEPLGLPTFCCMAQVTDMGCETDGLESGFGFGNVGG